MPQVSVVIVCMGNPQKHLYTCLDSIAAHNSVTMEVLVVAYRMSEENRSLLKEKYPYARIIVSDGTRGFSENNNLALKEAEGEYCFIVNDDTVQSMPVIDRLVESFGELPGNAAAISPCIRFADGSVQTLGRAPWTPWRYARHYLHLVDEAKPSAWSMKDGLFRSWTLNGACFLIKTDVFRRAGWFDERYFFTPEDIALGHKLNDMGFSVWANAGVSITHLAGGSVSSMESAIKPTRVRGSMIFYGEPLWLKCFIWCFEALRILRYAFDRESVNYRTARNVMETLFSKASPKEIFIRFSK